MAFNPHPKVADARAYARKWHKQQVVILSIDTDGGLEYVSYGADRRLCDEAKRLADVAYEAIVGAHQ